MKETKGTYQEWFLEQKTRCISQAEDLSEIEYAEANEKYFE